MIQTIKTWKPALISFVLMTLICGIVYPGIVTGIAQLAFSDQANGSIVSAELSDGSIKEYGSELIGQEFTQPEYLIGRSMGTTNLSPVSVEQERLVTERISFWQALDPKNKADIPMDLITASGSGCDPNISPEAAEYQISRIAKERGMEESEVRAIMEACSDGRFLGFWGEPSVNVLKVNLMLDDLK